MKILNRWVKKVTKDYTEIPLMWMCFNYKAYMENCTIEVVAKVYAVKRW